MTYGAHVTQPVIGAFAVRLPSGAIIACESKPHAEQVCAALQSAFVAGQASTARAMRKLLEMEGE